MGFAGSLKGKIALGYYGLGLLFAGLVAFALIELAAIEESVHQTEVANEFNDLAAQLRRLEKNYLLYGKRQDLRDAQRIADQLAQLQVRERQRLVAVAGRADVDAASAALQNYGRGLADLIRLPDDAPSPVAALPEHLRDSGSKLLAMAETLAGEGKRQLDERLATYRRQLFVSILLVALVVAGAGALLSRRILQPLRRLQADMESIADGRIRLLTSESAEPELASLTQAFNTVMSELSARQADLVQADKLASLGVMLSGVAHELNNPLSNISTSVQILAEESGQLDAAFHDELVAQIDSQTTRARDIVRILLDFSQERVFRLAPTPLRPLVEDTVRLARLYADDPVPVSVDIADSLQILADRHQMQQALLNLLRNAAEACAASGSILIRATGSPHGAAGVRLEIGDTGIGIPAASLAKIFDPFFTTKEVGKGTGLGLFLVHQIVQRHHGRITVTSTPGRGTVFVLELPAP